MRTNMKKKDMSGTCGFKDVEMYYKCENGEISNLEFLEYFNNNCGKCKYMCEICMYGEE